MALSLELNFGHVFQRLCLAMFVVCFSFFTKLKIGPFGNENIVSHVYGFGF